MPNKYSATFLTDSYKPEKAFTSASSVCFAPHMSLFYLWYHPSYKEWTPNIIRFSPSGDTYTSYSLAL
jgi:hypothetical protein